MASKLQNSLKVCLRKRIKGVLKSLTSQSIAKQSKAVTCKVLQNEAFRQAKRVSVYLSTNTELDTTELISEMFRLEKHVYVPTYKEFQMKMVRMRSLQELQELPMTKWNIKQPDFHENREDAMTNGHGIDLFIVPGVAFTSCGNRLGHGMGYYDSYLLHHMNKYPQKKVTYMGVGLNEQIVSLDELPMEEHDVRLHLIVTENS